LPYFLNFRTTDAGCDRVVDDVDEGKVEVDVPPDQSGFQDENLLHLSASVVDLPNKLHYKDFWL
jgi:hypothetical protein